MISLLENNKHLGELVIYIAGPDINEENQSKLKEVADCYGRVVKFLNVEKIEEQLKTCKINNYHKNNIIFYRLFIEQLIPDNIERILHIDSDTIVSSSIEELETFRFDENKTCAMIRERVFKGYNSIIGLKESDNYFNAGVILFDMNKWKTFNCSEKVLEGLYSGKANFHLADQDLLCSAINEHIQVLPFKFNVHSLWLSIGINNLYTFFDANESNLYSIDEIYKAIENPVILHCSRSISGTPWERGNKNPFKKEWNQYKEISPWKDIKDVMVKRKFRERIMWLMLKLLPRAMYMKLFKYKNKRSINNLYTSNV